MSPDQGEFIGEELPLRDYLLVIVRKWWVVAGVLGVTLVAAWAVTSQQPQVYEARTKLLIVSRVSEQLLGQEGSAQDSEALNPLLGTSLSVETLSALATANDLLQSIIDDLKLRDSSSGNHYSVEWLAGRMNPQVETAGLLTMTVRGDDPALVKSIANKWAEVFTQKNSELFATEAVRSYDFAVSRFEENQAALRDKEEAKLAYQQENPLASLASELAVLKGKYESFLGELQTKRAALVGAEAQLGSAEEAFEGETQFLTIERAISNDAIWALLADGSDRELEALPDLTIKEQLENILYFSLKDQIVSLRSKVATLTSEIDFLEVETAQSKRSIEELSGRIDSIRLTLSRLDEDIRILGDNRDTLSENLRAAQIARAEQTGPIRVVESAIEPAVPVGPARQRNLLLAAVLGLLLGVVLAFVVHYLQSPQSPR